MKRHVFYILIIYGLAGCSDMAQEGHARYAMEMLGKCEFQEAINASNEALRLSKENEIAFVSLTIKAKAHELIGNMQESEAVYKQMLVFSNISSIDNAKAATAKLEPLVQQCTNNS